MVGGVGVWFQLDKSSRVRGGQIWSPPPKKEKNRLREKRYRGKVVVGGGVISYSFYNSLWLTIYFTIVIPLYPMTILILHIFCVLNLWSNSWVFLKLDPSSRCYSYVIFCICVLMLVPIIPKGISPSDTN